MSDALADLRLLLYSEIIGSRASSLQIDPKDEQPSVNREELESQTSVDDALAMKVGDGRSYDVDKVSSVGLIVGCPSKRISDSSSETEPVGTLTTPSDDAVKQLASGAEVGHEV